MTDARCESGRPENQNQPTFGGHGNLISVGKVHHRDTLNNCPQVRGKDDDHVILINLLGGEYTLRKVIENKDVYGAEKLDPITLIFLRPARTFLPPLGPLPLPQRSLMCNVKVQHQDTGSAAFFEEPTLHLLFIMNRESESYR
jgi:hypothetical protein